MARQRFIKPSFYDDEKLAEISIFARYLYIGLWCHFDRSGFIEYGPKVFKKYVFPYDDQISPEIVEQLTLELVKSGRLVPFLVDFKRLLYCPAFKKHQHFHKNEKSVFKHLKLKDNPTWDFDEHRTSTVLAPDQHQSAPSAISYRLSAISYKLSASTTTQEQKDVVVVGDEFSLSQSQYEALEKTYDREFIDAALRSFEIESSGVDPTSDFGRATSALPFITRFNRYLDARAKRLGYSKPKKYVWAEDEA